MPISTIPAAGLSSGVPTRAQLPAGSVLQVVQGVTGTETSTSSSTYTDTTLTATITPTSSSSKILVIINHTECEKTAANGSNRMAMRLMRDSTALNSSGYFSSGNLYTATGLLLRGSIAFTFLDSPSSTSAITYKTQFRSNDATSQVTVQVNSSPSTITLMEIAG